MRPTTRLTVPQGPPLFLGSIQEIIHCRRDGGEGIKGNAPRIECTQAVSGKTCGNLHIATIAAATIRAKTQKVISIRSLRLRCMSGVTEAGSEEQEAGRAHSGKLTRPTIRLYSLARRAGRVDAYRASVHRHNEKLITS